MASITRKTPTGRLIEWVAKVRSTDSRHPDMGGVFVEAVENGCVVVSTDDYRLHLAEVPAETIEPGNYGCSFTKESITLLPNDMSFPDWRRVIHETTPAGQYQARRWGKHTAGGVSREICRFLRTTGVTINFAFLFDLADGNREVIYEVGVAVKDQKRKGVTFTAPDRSALIMPMLIEEN